MCYLYSPTRACLYCPQLSALYTTAQNACHGMSDLDAQSMLHTQAYDLLSHIPLKMVSIVAHGPKQPYLDPWVVQPQAQQEPERSKVAWAIFCISRQVSIQFGQNGPQVRGFQELSQLLPSCHTPHRKKITSLPQQPA